jgi:hypothetical protein
MEVPTSELRDGKIGTWRWKEGTEGDRLVVADGRKLDVSGDWCGALH